MGRKKFTPFVINEIEITDAASEGKSIARYNDKVIFVHMGVPGDVVKLNVFRSKRRFYDARVLEVIKPSPWRIQPNCAHFGVCGGCKWQNLLYEQQLHYKQKQVFDNFTRIGKLDFSSIDPIAPCPEQFFYRNKLEFTFSNKRWLTEAEIADKTIDASAPTLGFHVPERFDKIIGIEKCWLQNDLSNTIRNFIKHKSVELELSFYNHYEKAGDMRNIILRNTVKNEWMLIVVFGSDVTEKHTALMQAAKEQFPDIKTLVYVVNKKVNDTIGDQELHTFYGDGYISEWLGDLKFKVSPKSFFQTNTKQALTLYEYTRNFAGLTGNELVYDLYTGTGTIANFVASKAKHVVGIEYVEDAITDAKLNSQLNNIKNTSFYAGDMKDMLTDDFLHSNGYPDVVITDPPRNGMHADVVEMIKKIKAKTVVYVSCNPATQARDLDLLRDTYKIEKIQPVDMFPQTHHVECVVKLALIQ
ncbi:MAG TPA: 23S rRNA (uracil(1939)-C(5))-methyltransferase RlmD [Flavobacteriales bacterium]|nr:23S rRNA (uracil(1939)-C(5))-methyltransferase RlmD [Flavobacteriales bacterium]